MKENVYDLIIIGSGPAGLSAAIYAKRAELNTLVIEKEYISGGQVVNTYEVDNYPGIPGSVGLELGMKFREHADKMGAEFVTEEVTKVVLDQRIKKVITEENEYQSKTVLIATGSEHKKLDVPGEDTLAGMGVSYCATCDGAFFKDRDVVVAGGGDVAVEDALFLSKICRKVYLIHRRDTLRAAKILQTSLFQTENVEVLWDSEISEIYGDDSVESILYYNKKTQEEKHLNVDGVFVAIGIAPKTDWMGSLIVQDEAGFIRAEEDGITSVPGVFAAGDIRTKALRQIVTAASDGANAVFSVQNYLLTF